MNSLNNELRINIGYYGPGVSGKTSNLVYIYTSLTPDVKGGLVSLKIRGDRRIAFDFVIPEIGTIGGKTPRFYLFCAPGCVRYPESHAAVLAEADAIVFVADSQADRLEANIEMLSEMKKTLLHQGRTMENFSWIIQYNKRDLPNVAPIQELQLKLNPYRVPYFEAVANQRIGVFETLKAIIDLKIANFRQRRDHRILLGTKPYYVS